MIVANARSRREHTIANKALGVRVAIDRDIGKVAQELRGAVFLRREGEEMRIGIDEACGGIARAEQGIRDHVFQERNVGFYTANTEFPQCAIHAVQSDLIGAAKDGDLHQHGIVVGGDDRVLCAQCAIESDAESSGAAVGENLAEVRREMVFRILGGDAALDGES